MVRIKAVCTGRYLLHRALFLLVLGIRFRFCLGIQALCDFADFQASSSRSVCRPSHEHVVACMMSVRALKRLQLTIFQAVNSSPKPTLETQEIPGLQVRETWELSRHLRASDYLFLSPRPHGNASSTQQQAHELTQS